ncbi:RIP metalloprotease RseP [Megasphaera paucivorans]|uniref:Zinc metalloprotease n=1 Tax=Megasphaera paucivorans TaxID=349095 RepID=A0A1G9RYT5_9FIRM|nr:RIP metalloprotease RseP [Megasphaera paucivorans]SDM27655.1 regulator of sigma E protease [Megasphaera paucivorans]
MLVTIAATVFVFSVIVFVHELGHFMTAKATGMQVDEFAIGFGPKIYSYQYGPTLYSLRAIPLGGFNRISGMSEEEELTATSFLSKGVSSRLFVIAAGAAMNFILAIFIIWGLMFTIGTKDISSEPIVGSVMTDSAASAAHIEKGDRIIAISGISIEKWSDISAAVAQHSQEVLTVTVQRNNENIDLTMIPKLEAQTQRPIIGVVPVIITQNHGFFESAVLSVERTGQICKMMIVGLYHMAAGTEKADIAGPIGVAQLAGQVASLGFVNLLMFTAFLSINLGIINLLPIPMLDGGYIILLILEGVTRRRLPARALYYMQMVGMCILAAVFIFAMMQDISRF